MPKVPAVVLFCLICLRQNLQAFPIKIVCEASGRLLSRTIEPPTDPLTALTVTNGLGIVTSLCRKPKCPNPLKSPSEFKNKDRDPQSVYLFSQLNSRARIFSSHTKDPSSGFNRSTLQEIIVMSIRNGTDPYVALAIFTHENRKKLGGPYSDTREFLGDSFHQESELQILGCKLRPAEPGELEKQMRSLNITAAKTEAFLNYEHQQMACLPFFIKGDTAKYKDCLDSAPIPDFFKSMTADEKEHVRAMAHCSEPGANCSYISGNGKQVKVVDLTRRKTNGSALTTESYGCFSGVQVVMNFEQSPEAANGKCCIKIRSNSKLPEHFSFRNHMSALKIRDELKLSEKESAELGSSSERLSLALQKYNGLGMTAKESSLENKCIAQMNQRERPIYGATVADIMYNLFLANPEVREMVEQSYQSFARPQQDQMCLILGRGQHEFDSLYFAKLQQKFLHDDNAAPNRYSECTKKVPNITFGPWTQSDAAAFF